MILGLSFLGLGSGVRLLCLELFYLGFKLLDLVGGHDFVGLLDDVC